MHQLGCGKSRQGRRHAVHRRRFRLAALAAFRGFQLLPVAFHLPGVGGAAVGEHVRVATDELAVDGGQYVGDVEVAGGAGDVGVKGHLDQNVAQFLGQFRRIAPVNGLQRFVALLQQVAFQGFVGLLSIPRAAAGAAQAGHNVNKGLEFADLGFGDG